MAVQLLPLQSPLAPLPLPPTCAPTAPYMPVAAAAPMGNPLQRACAAKGCTRQGPSFEHAGLHFTAAEAFTRPVPDAPQASRCAGQGSLTHLTFGWCHAGSCYMPAAAVSLLLNSDCATRGCSSSLHRVAAAGLLHTCLHPSHPHLACSSGPAAWPTRRTCCSTFCAACHTVQAHAATAAQ